MAKAALWLKDLRSLVRREHGAGWVLEGANDRFKIQKIEGERRGAKRPTVRTQIPFAPSSSTDVLNLINTLSENKKERNIGLGDAYQLLNNAPIDKTSNAVDWEEIKNKYYNRSSIKKEITNLCKDTGEDVNNLRFKIINVEHHLTHIASAFYLSKFKDKTAAFTYDGSGDAVSITLAECHDNKIKILEKVFLPKSLGHFYSAICNYIGFKNFGEEYKVMGLSAYGKDRYLEYFNELIGYDKKKIT